MQNDFEKRVKQKMEELDFVPSEPVWTNIEKEIRKKDKRRFFIWLPVLLLLVGGGIYWNYSMKKSINDATEQQQLSKINSTSNQTNPVIKETDKTLNANKKEQNKSASLIINADKFNINSSEHRVHSNKNIFRNEQPSRKNSLIKKKSILINKANITYVPISDISPVDNNNSSLIENNRKDLFSIEHLLNIPQINPIFDAVEREVVKENPENERKVVVHQKHYWVIGIEGSIGVSNQTSGQGSTDKSYTASSPGIYPPSNSIVQSPYTKAISFSTGLTVKRKLGKQIEFQTGITYQYLSFNVLVGQFVKQDTVVNMYALNQYYRNTSFSVNQTWTLSNYKNQLHFITVPLKFGFRPFSKIPVKLSAGILLQELIHSNMLVYDASSGVYYSSIKSLNKFLISSTAGIEYSFPFLKHTFSVGPYIDYGLSNTIKDKPGYLYNINFKASVDFKKLNRKQRF